MAAEPRELSALYNFWVAQNAGLTPLACYNPFDVASGQQMGSNCGPTGTSSQGPVALVFRRNWAQARGGPCSASNWWGSVESADVVTKRAAAPKSIGLPASTGCGFSSRKRSARATSPILETDASGRCPRRYCTQEAHGDGGAGGAA
jgi:hypothetical protein